jgi:hypothetical protein
MRIDLAIRKCFKNNIKVYPVVKNWKIYIEADINGKKKFFNKEVTGKAVNKAMESTYKFYANQL